MGLTSTYGLTFIDKIATFGPVSPEAIRSFIKSRLWLLVRTIEARDIGEDEVGDRTIAKCMTWLVLICIISSLALVFSIDDKCAACNAVAEELEWGLSKEKPRNHLDMRHRLDSTGQREGKLIDYKVSDLRVVELLDGLCEKMQDYTLRKVDSTREEWFRVDDWDKLTENKQEARAYAKDISSYCGRLLEETEDELSDLIKKGSVKLGGVGKVLCQDLSKHCSQLSSQKADGEDKSGRLDGEL